MEGSSCASSETKTIDWATFMQFKLFTWRPDVASPCYLGKWPSLPRTYASMAGARQHRIDRTSLRRDGTRAGLNVIESAIYKLSYPTCSGHVTYVRSATEKTPALSVFALSPKPNLINPKPQTLSPKTPSTRSQDNQT